MSNDADLPIKIFKPITQSLAAIPAAEKDFFIKFRVSLPDRPGSLASFASLIAQAQGNISFFHYDRSLDSSRVAVEVHIPAKNNLDSLVAALRSEQFFFDTGQGNPDEVSVTALEHVLEVKTRLANQPGSLAAFARLLADHGANVLYMLYDEDIDPESTDIAMAVRDHAEITLLLNAMNEQGYSYRVLYRGDDPQEAANVIGLKLVEKFFLRLKKLLPASDVDELKSLVASSRDLHQDLVNFYTEAGKNLEAGDVFEKVLTFASRSRSKTGDHFFCKEMKPLEFPGGLSLHGFRLPTSENIYLFRQGEELAMIDAGHGIYYDDVKRLIRSKSWDPAKLARIFITHPDTDHSGMAGYFEQEFGSTVYLHPESAAVIAARSRAPGVAGPLGNLNKYYTRLSNRFTECRFPEHPSSFATTEIGTFGMFRVIDRFFIGQLAFDVLESRGGHTPGLVFFLNKEYGLLFTSDFLIQIASLQPDEKEHLGIYRYLLTSPNRDNAVYQEESAGLREIILDIDGELRKTGRSATIFPGHGECYAARDLRA